MLPRTSEQLARRYVAWTKRRALWIVLAHLVVLAGSGYLIAFHLPLFADFSYLLPQDAPAVVDLRKLDTRVKSNETLLVLVDAPTPEVRAAVVREMTPGIEAISKDLVDRVDTDDAATRAWFRERRALFVPYADLVKARDALARRIKAAKLAANPLFIDLDDKPAGPDADKQTLDDLRKKRHDAEARLDQSANISANGKIALLLVRTALRGTDVNNGERLLAELGKVRAHVLAAHPDVKIGFTSGIVTAIAEHGAIFKGIVTSSIVTTLLVALVLALYFRSATMLVLLITTLGIATAAAFGATSLTIGHLNAATGFLGAIIAGNGVNYGILLIARYLEERRRHEVDDAMAAAIVGTLQPTAVAALGAAIAYGSLAATSFKGFADFAVIGAIGMILCWIATFLLLPALVTRFGRKTRVRTGDPILGTVLVKLIGFRNSRLVVAVSAVVLAIAGVITVRYVAADPFEYDIKQLRSEGADAALARSWMDVSDANFGRGIAGRTYIAADRPEQVPLIIDALRARDIGKPIEEQTIGSINSIEDVVPADQTKKLAVLAEIRAQLDDDALSALGDDERKELTELRPPDDLVAITPETLPPAVREQLTEKDGRIGYLISVRPGPKLNEWNGHHLIRFADAVRSLKLPDGETVTTSGPSVIFADIIRSIKNDGPIVTVIAAIGLFLMVVLLVGRNRQAVAVLVATVSGSMLMVAICAVLGMHVNFLNFVALPITLGLGVDYAINVAHRYNSDAIPDAIATLRTSGSAVFVCSLTTIIGYGSLLVSDNLAIRGFGAASLLGELTCLATALILVPALLAVRLTKRDPSR